MNIQNRPLSKAFGTNTGCCGLSRSCATHFPVKFLRFRQINYWTRILNARFFRFWNWLVNSKIQNPIFYECHPEIPHV